MTKRMKVGDFIVSAEPELLSSPQHRRVIRMFSKEFILSANSIKSKYNTTSHNSNNSNKKSINRNSDFTPRSKRPKHIHLDSDIISLNSKYKNSLKNSIIHSKDLDLLEKKIKILEAEEHKNESSLCRSQELERIKKRRKNENIRQKSLIKNCRRLREKEMEEKKSKVKDLRDKENNGIETNKKNKKINSDNCAVKKNEMKQKILEDLSKEKDKINEENQRKINFIKKMDIDILKRKMDNDKRKKAILMKQLEQEIKLQEQFNQKLLGKIYKYQKTGIKKIERLMKYQ
jgi:hypothetical protein